jgi:hypothetical protein
VKEDKRKERQNKTKYSLRRYIKTFHLPLQAAAENAAKRAKKPSFFAVEPSR